MKSTAYRFSRNQAYWPLAQGFSRPSSAHRNTSSRLMAMGGLFGTLLGKIVTQLTVSDEPRVWISRDAAGNTLWNAYDSVSDRIIRDASETELRIWLEHRYQF